MKNFYFPAQQGDASDVWMESWLADNGYDHYVGQLSIDVEQVNDFLLAVEPDDILNLGNYNSRAVIAKDDFVMLLNTREGYCRIFTKGTLFGISDFVERYKSYFIATGERAILVDYFYQVDGDVRIRQINLNLNRSHVTHPELYPEIDICRLNEAFQTADDSILILQGQPGVGKTTFIKYMLDQGKYRGRVAYVKDMGVMMSSDFWASVAGRNYGVLIFDDLDFALGPRRENSNSHFVSNLLSYSDGIFNQRSKIIITTNQDVNEMDEALVRPGRCFDFLVLSPISYESAKNIWVNHLHRSLDEFNERFSTDLAEINQADLMSAYRTLTSGNDRGYYRNGGYLSLRHKLERSGVRLGTSRMSL